MVSDYQGFNDNMSLILLCSLSDPLRFIVVLLFWTKRTFIFIFVYIKGKLIMLCWNSHDCRFFENISMVKLKIYIIYIFLISKFLISHTKTISCKIYYYFYDHGVTFN